MVGQTQRPAAAAEGAKGPRGRGAEGAGRRAQGAGRRAQGAGREGAGREGARARGADLSESLRTAKESTVCTTGVFAIVGGLWLLAAGGCIGELIANQTEESLGTVNVLLINNTRYRASFTIGAFDDLDRDPPGQVSLQQFRVEANTSNPQFTLPCVRDVSVATQKLVDRIFDTNANDAPNFDRDAFDTVVHFSSAPAGSDGEALPDVGTAEGINVRVGNDYTCNDLLIFTFEQDAAAPGGFRIDFELVADVEDDR